METETVVSLPAAKRVRWDRTVVEKSPTSFGNVQQDPQDVPSCSATEAIRLISVGVDAAQFGAGAEHKPDFTHQLFNGERIMGYAEGEVAIRVAYSAASVHFLVEVRTNDNDADRIARISTNLSKALPAEDYSTDKTEFERLLPERQRDFRPPGTRVHDYKRQSKTFAIYRATGEDCGACQYHERAQSLAPWFIETADRINIMDDRWEVFYLFEEETPREVLGDKWRPAALAGYFTVFGFRNPVKGLSLRICQALVLPQYQRQGHGQALLTYLYGLARERDSVFEITVEDPAPGFEKLRNLIDARLLRDNDAFPADLLVSETFQRPTKETIQAAHKALKLTVSQVEIGFDVIKARDIVALVKPARAFTTTSLSADRGSYSPKSVANVSHERDQTQDGIVEDSDEKCKRYRLMVKRRLLKRHAEELSSDAQMRKHQLEEFYREVESVYLSLGVKLRREESTIY